MNDHRNDSWLDERARETMERNGFRRGFGADVAEQVEQLTDEIDVSGAADLRHLLWSSIDNATSRDLDQVEWAERLENGDIRLLVGIADVDSRVPKDSPADRHAGQNTVSVYTQSEVFPMLPERLSTDLTSLNEGVDRLAIVAEMVVKANGDVPESRFFRAVVHNHARFSYDEIGDWLAGGKRPEKIEGRPELREQLELQHEAAQRLYAYRKAKGALEFESMESSAVVQDGQIKDLVGIRPNAARKLIENFMIATNVEMAEFLEAHGIASLRRVVKTPQRWESIRKIAGELGGRLPEQPDQPALAAFLAKRRDADPEHFPDLSLSIVKLIGAGEYVVERPGKDSGGHFGLAVRDYAHSTAPNRRYADLVVQRLVKGVIDGAAKPAYSAEELDEIATHINAQEKNARKVERKMRKIVAATVMQKRIGERFEAIVTGITPHGTFARILRPPVDGRIEKGEHGLEVGQKTSVRLISANPNTGFIDFAALR
jgi:VacB/RNase II family 3'-5' exoribonuclease